MKYIAALALVSFGADAMTMKLSPSQISHTNAILAQAMSTAASDPYTNEMAFQAALHKVAEIVWDIDADHNWEVTKAELDGFLDKKHKGEDWAREWYGETFDAANANGDDTVCFNEMVAHSYDYVKGWYE